MKLKPQKFTLEDFKDQRSWIGNLFSPLNQLLNDLFIAFTNQITVEDNLYQEIREINFKNQANNFPYKFRTKFSSYPKGMVCVYLFNSDTGEISNEVPSFVWSYGNQEISISQISGLSSNVSYVLRLLIIYG